MGGVAIRLARFLADTHVLLAFAAVCALDCYSVFYPNDHFSIFPLIFFGTLLVYNLHRFAKFRFGGYNPDSAAYTWTKGHLFLVISLAVGSLGALLLTGWQITPKSVFYLSLPGFLALFYTIPVFPFRGKVWALRDIPFMKAILVAVAWSYVTVWYPQVFQTGRFFPENPFVWIFFAGRFLLFYILTGLSDIRDMDNDRPGLYTLPQIMGAEGARLVFYIMLFLVAFSGFLCWHGGYLPGHLLAAFWCGHLVLAYFIYGSGKKQSPYFYTVGVDGVLILQWLFAAAFSLFWHL
jgi:hypothetical protein